METRTGRHTASTVDGAGGQDAPGRRRSWPPRTPSRCAHTWTRQHGGRGGWRGQRAGDELPGGGWWLDAEGTHVTCGEERLRAGARHTVVSSARGSALCTTDTGQCWASWLVTDGRTAGAAAGAHRGAPIMAPTGRPLRLAGGTGRCRAVTPGGVAGWVPRGPWEEATFSWLPGGAEAVSGGFRSLTEGGGVAGRPQARPRTTASAAPPPAPQQDPGSVRARLVLREPVHLPAGAGPSSLSTSRLSPDVGPLPLGMAGRERPPRRGLPRSTADNTLASIRPLPQRRAHSAYLGGQPGHARGSPCWAPARCRPRLASGTELVPPPCRGRSAGTPTSVRGAVRALVRGVPIRRRGGSGRPHSPGLYPGTTPQPLPGGWLCAEWPMAPAGSLWDSAPQLLVGASATASGPLLGRGPRRREMRPLGAGPPAKELRGRKHCPSLWGPWMAGQRVAGQQGHTQATWDGWRRR